MAAPLQVLAANESIILQPKMTSSNDSDNIPLEDEISSDPNYSEGFTMTRSSLYGKCFIQKLSSHSLKVSGYTHCMLSNSCISIKLKLQAYYDGSWHTLKMKSNSKIGTRVDLSQVYNVTSGFYYRVLAIHSNQDGTVNYTQTKGILVK